MTKKQIPWRALWLIVLVIGSALLAGNGNAYAHPEDEFCGPDTTIDPVLCEQLSKAVNGDGDVDALFVDPDGERRAPLSVGLSFANIGIQHILPGGLDHILFVLALFLAAQNIRSLVLQISAFTVAHTVTLGLAAAGVVDPRATVVEPIIAASIAFVAIENIYFQAVSRWRLPVIFGFGLFHGLGFAGFVREIGLPSDQFWSALIGFNIGVEIGQLSVVLAAALLSRPIYQTLTKNDVSYRDIVVVPASFLIAATGLWWALTRSIGF